jgi:hypothetical protein
MNKVNSYLIDQSTRHYDDERRIKQVPITYMYDACEPGKPSFEAIDGSGTVVTVLLTNKQTYQPSEWIVVMLYVTYGISIMFRSNSNDLIAHNC